MWFFNGAPPKQDDSDDKGGEPAAMVDLNRPIPLNAGASPDGRSRAWPTTLDEKRPHQSDRTVATRSCSSDGSVDSSSRSIVTFREGKRVPKSENAMRLSTSSHEEVKYPFGNQVENFRRASSPTNLESNLKHNGCSVRDTNIEERTNVNSTTSSMFTKEEIDSITQLQINTYLTLEEREKIGTKVLSSKVMKGYQLINSSSVCDTCGMPKLSKSNKPVRACPVCPVLKKKVLQKILDGCRC